MQTATRAAIEAVIAAHPHEDIQPMTATECSCGRALLEKIIHWSGTRSRICPVTLARYRALYGEPRSFTVIEPAPAPTGSWRERLRYTH